MAWTTLIRDHRYSYYHLISILAWHPDGSKDPDMQMARFLSKVVTYVNGCLDNDIVWDPHACAIYISAHRYVNIPAFEERFDRLLEEALEAVEAEEETGNYKDENNQKGEKT